MKVIQATFVLWASTIEAFQPHYGLKRDFLLTTDASVSTLTSSLEHARANPSLANYTFRNISRLSNTSSSNPETEKQDQTGSLFLGASGHIHTDHSTQLPNATKIIATFSNLGEPPISAENDLNNTSRWTILSHNSSHSSLALGYNSTTLSVSTSTCPKTYSSDLSVVVRTNGACEDRDADLGSLYLYKSYSDRCLASYCQSSYDAETTRISTWPGWFRFKPFHNVTLSNGETTFTQASTYTNISWTWYSTFRSYQPPCCGACTIYPHSIELYLWPEQKTPPSSELGNVYASTFIDESGYTFVSPSVYVALSTFSARDACGLIGTVIPSTTIAFDLNELSTVAYGGQKTCFDVSENSFGLSTLTPFSLLTRALTLSDLFRENCTVPEFPWYTYTPGNPFNFFMPFDPCHPYILLPQKVKNLQEGWATCNTQTLPGLYDPPKTLQPGLVLVPSTTSASDYQTVAPTPGQEISRQPKRTSDHLNPTNEPVIPDLVQPSHPASHVSVAQIAAPRIQTGPGPLLTIILPNQPPPISVSTVPDQPYPPGFGDISGSPAATNPIVHPGQSPIPSFAADTSGELAPTGEASVALLVLALPPQRSLESNRIVTITSSMISGNPVIIIDGQTLGPGSTAIFEATSATRTDAIPNVIIPTRTTNDPQGASIIPIVGTLTTTIDLNILGLTSARASGSAGEILQELKRAFKFHATMYTVDVANHIVIEGKTLTPGSAIVVDGTRLFFEHAATAVVIGQGIHSTVILTTVTDITVDTMTSDAPPALGYTVYLNDGPGYVILVKGKSTTTLWPASSELTTNSIPTAPFETLADTTTLEMAARTSTARDAHATKMEGTAPKSNLEGNCHVPRVIVMILVILELLGGYYW